MSCKYDIIDEGGRKRVRALRPFTVQGRDVCPMELGGYVYDANTLSQDGNCWIFSGSLEYPGVRVMDEAIVDMGNNLPKSNTRPKATIISGNSRIMGAISFETQSFDVAQTPAMFEQGGYTANVGAIPVKAADGSRIRVPAQLFSGTAGSVAITNPLYQARLVFIGENGLVTGTSGTWVTGGPAVTLPAATPYFLVEVRKTAITALTPADVTAAGVTVTAARESELTLFNSSLVPVYNGAVVSVNNVLRLLLGGTAELPTKLAIQNSYVRAECGFDSTNTFALNADFTKVNYNLVLTPNVSHFITGTYRNTNINTPASVSIPVARKTLFDVTDCPNFEYSTVTFPDLTAMNASGKTFYFKQCNMPVGSAIHYYDPKVNVWDNIDFTKAMADLGKDLPKNENIVLVSSNKQGLYRMYGKTYKSIGALVEALSSVKGANFEDLDKSYDTVIYKDHTITGTYYFKGCNVFGGTQDGASQLVNDTGVAIEIDGSFRIEGNAQVTDTPLKGTGYIGDNAELKNGNVEGYVYMADNAKFIPKTVANKPSICRLVMLDNAQITKQANAAGATINIEMGDNAVIGAVVVAQFLAMAGNAEITSDDDVASLTADGVIFMKDNAKIIGTGRVISHGHVELVGGFNLSAGSRTIYGKHVIASPDDVNRPELPPTKATW